LPSSANHSTKDAPFNTSPLASGTVSALLGGHQQRQIIGVAHQQVVPPAKDRRTLLGRLAAPGGQRALGRLDRATGLGSAHVGHLDDHLPVGRIGDREHRLRLSARHPLAGR
jgi:hypothetical protein